MPIYDNVDDLEKLLADIAAFALESSFPGTQVILSHEGGEEPKESYVSVYPLGISNLTRRYTSTLTDEPNAEGYGTLMMNSNYEIRVQYSFLGSKGFPMALAFYHAIDTNALVLEELARTKLGILEKQDVRNVPQLRETDWVKNYTVDVTYSFALRTDIPILTVETVVLVDPLTGVKITIPPP